MLKNLNHNERCCCFMQKNMVRHKSGTSFLGCMFFVAFFAFPDLAKCQDSTTLDGKITTEKIVEPVKPADDQTNDHFKQKFKPTIPKLPSRNIFHPLLFIKGRLTGGVIFDAETIRKVCY